MGRQTVSQLLDAAERTRERTRAAQKRVAERRVERKATPCFDNLPDPSSGHTPKEVLSSVQVQEWMTEALHAKFGAGLIIEPWTRQQQKLAKDLLAAYGGELVRKAVTFFVESWDALVEGSNGRLSGVPSINLLFAMRARIFGDVQLGKEPQRPRDRRHDSEHRGPREKGRGVGW